MIWRGYLDFVYTQCQRCERKVPISDCSWCNGFLVCHIYGCFDRVINGAFEIREAKEVGRDCHELVPDDKLVNPVDPLSQLENLPASSGTW